jgi:lipopolysaccharide/colanic/teichoic acid biosynthesis glycosyltransferase
MVRRKTTVLLENGLSSMRRTTADLGMLPEGLFIKVLRLERKRTERSGRRFVLMLVDPGHLLKSHKGTAQARLLSAVSVSSRDTDVKGWYKQDSIIGVIFTEIAGDCQSVVEAISSKLMASLRRSFSVPEIERISLTFHIVPEDWDVSSPDAPTRSTQRTVTGDDGIGDRAALTVKRLIDIAGSVAGLAVCLPVMLCIAAAIKLTSKGPVLFRQVRVGQYGRPFTFLKFRSMYVDSDHGIHETYVDQFIKGASGTEQDADNNQRVYKLTKDPRITRVGRLLRNSSLDELPQFVNVLLGHMSLVGPRPPIVYEVARYDLWHRQRLQAVKPGITGLWQVEGRSRVKFDEMVRLDIRYARSWSLWLDIKILLQTPRAVFSGFGAC